MVDGWLKQFPNLHIFPHANMYAHEPKTLTFGVVSVFYFRFIARVSTLQQIDNYRPTEIRNALRCNALRCFVDSLCQTTVLACIDDDNGVLVITIGH